jgi:lipopolysaccharide/colanic/teichoic acid biosynthesis glycosyltransferase
MLEQASLISDRSTDDQAAFAGARSARGQSRLGGLSGRIAVRGLDLLVAVLVLIVLAPLLLVIAVMVRLDSSGPSVFRQRRVGRGLEPFQLYKFRTMRSGADTAPHQAYVQALIASAQTSEKSEKGQLYKLAVDDRITRVGRVLRSWSLDELPQLINVLKGEMSLVGPRPVIPYEVEQYPQEYLGRFSVKPGLTGLWQVSGRNTKTYHEMVTADLEYAETRSLWIDIKILFKTIPVVLLRKGVA